MWRDACFAGHVDVAEVLERPFAFLYLLGVGMPPEEAKDELDVMVETIREARQQGKVEKFAACH